MFTEEFLFKLYCYFELIVLNSTLFPKIPSVGIGITLYIFSFRILFNFPALYSRNIESYIQLGVIPTHWDISKINEGDNLFKYFTIIRFRKSYSYEKLLRS